MNVIAEQGGPVRAVLIDDTEDIRYLLRYALTKNGVDVVGEAGDGQAGIDMVRESRPDVVMLDLAMPVMDGLEALVQIRSLVPDARILVLSSFATAKRAEVLSRGADRCIEKGTSLKQIVEYVQQAC